jgi:hypothetical protein
MSTPRVLLTQGFMQQVVPAHACRPAFEQNKVETSFEKFQGVIERFQGTESSPPHQLLTN